MKFNPVVLATLTGMAFANPLEPRAGEEGMRQDVAFSQLCQKFQGDNKDNLCRAAIRECDSTAKEGEFTLAQLRKLPSCVGPLGSLEIPSLIAIPARICYAIPDGKCQEKVDACAGEQNIDASKGMQKEKWPAFIQCMDKSRLA